MPSYPPSADDFQFQHTLAPFLQAGGLRLAEVLTEAALAQACADETLLYWS